MKWLYLAVLAALLLGTLLQSTQAQSIQQQKGLYERPIRLHDLTDLDLVSGADLSASQKTEVLLSWLVQERNTPSSTTTGLGGGPIDSNYIQTQIVKGIGAYGDPTAVQWVLSSASLKDESIRNAMCLVLGSLGDKSQVTQIENILLNEPNPYLRAIAAQDLAELGSVGSIPVLEKATQDTFHSTFASESHEGRVIAFYPVRETTQESLKILHNPALVKFKMARNQYSVKRLTEARLYASTHPFQSERITNILAQRQEHL